MEQVHSSAIPPPLDLDAFIEVKQTLNPHEIKPDDDDFISECRKSCFHLVIEPTDSVEDTIMAALGYVPWESLDNLVFSEDERFVAGGHKLETWFWFDHSQKGNPEYLTVMVYKNHLSRVDQCISDDETPNVTTANNRIVSQLAIDLTAHDGGRFQKGLQKKVSRKTQQELFSDQNTRVTYQEVIADYQSTIGEFSALSHQLEQEIGIEMLSGKSFVEAYRALLDFLSVDLESGINSRVIDGLQKQLHQLAVRAEKLEGILESFCKKYLKLPETNHIDFIELLKNISFITHEAAFDHYIVDVSALADSGDVDQIMSALNISHDIELTQAEREMFLGLFKQAVTRRSQYDSIEELRNNIDSLQTGYRSQLRNVVLDLVADATPGQKIAQHMTMAYQLVKNWLNPPVEVDTFIVD